MNKEYIQVQFTIDKKDKATEIADTLLKKRLVACVQIIEPITSKYWWNGKIKSSYEILCICKTRTENYKQIESVIKSIHNYDVPEILAIKIVDGNIDYFNWIDEETRNNI